MVACKQKREADNHDTPILVSGHDSTFHCGNQHAFQVKVVPWLVHVFVLLPINLYITFVELGTFTSVSLFMAVVTVMSGLEMIYNILFISIPSAREHLKSQERRVWRGDVTNTVPEPSLPSIRGWILA